MRYERVLLVAPPYYDDDFGASLPAGLGYLAESLRSHGLTYRILDLNLAGSDAEDLFHAIEDFQPDLIGFSLLTFRYLGHYELIRMVKERYPRIAIVAGGAHLSNYRVDVLRQCPAIDFGAVLEGEESLAELCAGKELNKIGGLIFRQGEEIRFNGERPFVRDLDALAWPRYEGFQLNNYVFDHVGLLTSRGCPYSCGYCDVFRVIGKKWRMRSSTSICDELDYWVWRGHTHFVVLDDNMTIRRDRMIELCDEIERRGLHHHVRIACNNGIRADRVDREVLQRMWRAGFYRLSFGVDGFNDKMMEIMNRAERLEDVERAIRYACELGFDVVLFFILGYPGETWEDIKDGAELALKYPVLDAVFNNLIPYPNTEVYDYLKKGGFLLRAPEEYLNSQSRFRDFKPIFSTREMGVEDRKRAYRYMSGVRKKVRRRAIARRLGRFGGINHLAAWVFSWDLTQHMLHHNKKFRETMIRIYQHAVKQATYAKT
ncbi:MAG: B12-binding domain-containing radical SAM protein [Terriglobia bacterium]